MPTDLGNEFIDFITDIDEYDSVSIKFIDKVIQLPDVSDGNNDKLIKRKLGEKGWSPDEINSYKNVIKDATDVARYFAWPSAIINIFIIRYISLLVKVGSYKNSEIAEQILYHIVMNAISNQFKNEWNLYTRRKR